MLLFVQVAYGNSTGVLLKIDKLLVVGVSTTIFNNGVKIECIILLLLLLFFMFVVN